MDCPKKRHPSRPKIKGRKLLVHSIDITLVIAPEIGGRIGPECEHDRVYSSALGQHLTQNLHVPFVDAVKHPYCYGTGYTGKGLFIYKFFPTEYIQLTPAANS